MERIYHSDTLCQRPYNSVVGSTTKCTVFHYHHLSAWYDLNIVERDVKQQIIFVTCSGLLLILRRTVWQSRNFAWLHLECWVSLTALYSALENFIRAKYETKKYIAKEWIPPKPTVPKEVRKFFLFPTPPPSPPYYFVGEKVGTLLYSTSILNDHSNPSADSRKAVVSFWWENVHKYWFTT